MSPLLSLAIDVALACYALALAIALVRLLRGPAAEERILALDFMGIVAILVLLVVGIRYRSSMTFEAALLIALTGFVATAALAKFLLRGEVIE
ncbi:MAG: K+/H+ antiporter subunit F [Burkholderiales bacterium]|jgi:multicomponent K+:H+ antiporter subunit F|nr:K+/H+ antiporter subunit F [Burkholderiales bacterium]